MKKIICAGAYVVNSNNRKGSVVVLDKKNNVAFIRGKHGFWTDDLSNLKVLSYKGLEGE